MKPPTELALKNAAVEEWTDVHFFRPLGIRVARGLMPTRITADQVTVAALVVGLAGSHFFLYDSWRLGLVGLALLIASDILDSADGQLARLRGTATRFGRALDGVSDNLRFLSLYLHLLFRMWAAGEGWLAVELMLLGGMSHALQATATDFIRQAYLRLTGRPGELDLPEDLGEPPTGFWYRLAFQSYARYLRRQARLFPATVAAVRLHRGNPPTPREAAAYDDALRPLIRSAPWNAQNIRFALLAITAVPGWPAGYFWLCLIPLNVVLVTLVLQQERRVRRLAAGATAPGAAYVA